MAVGAVIGAAVIGAGTAIYTSEQNSKAIAASRPQLPPAPPTLADESTLSDQRRKRLMSATGRDGTVLAPPGINGSPLGGPSATPGAVPAKNTLGG